MLKYKIGLLIFFGIFMISGTTQRSSETVLNEVMNPIEYSICDDDGFVSINIQDIQADILADYDSPTIEEAIVISTSTGAVIKLNNISGTISIALICDLSNSLSDIAVDENGVIYATDFGSIFALDQSNCTTSSLPNLGSIPNTNSLSFDTQGNLYFGGANISLVYRYDSDELNPAYIWHDFGSGAPSGDFVVLNGKIYISWEINNDVFLYEVTIDANFNYVSHINLGMIIPGTFGLASELGNLYGVATGELYKIDLDTFTFDTVIINDFTYGAWFGAAGLNEAVAFDLSSYDNLADATNSLNPLPDVWTNTQQGGQTIFIRVENTLTGAFEIIEVDIVIYDNLPDLVTPTGLTICADQTNTVFDLTDVETELLQNVPHAVTVTYYDSDQDAIFNVSPLDPNYTATSNQETIYVRVQNVDNECFSVAEFEVEISPIPVIVTPTNLTQCEDQNSGIFTLTDVETELLQNNTDMVTVTYYTSATNATAGTNALATQYEISGTQETIFVRVENDVNGCFATTQFDLIYNESLQISTPSDITQCASNNTFNLTQVESDLLINTPLNVAVSYHASEIDANTNSNPLSTNYTATSNEDTIFIRVQSTLNNCFAVTQFNVITEEALNIQTPTNLVLCEGINNGLFDLTAVEGELLQNVTETVIVTYYTSPENAIAATTAIDTNYTLTSGQATIYVRVESTGSLACFETTQFMVQILENPIVEAIVNSPSARLLTDCYIDSNSDGFFDLNDSYDEIITNGNTNYSLTFYLSENDAEQEINSINPIYYATEAEEIFVTVTNSNGCKSITNFFVNPNCYDTVIDISNIYFPEFFTPNNDTINDIWNVRGISLAVQRTAFMYIFDRYGKLLYYYRPGQDVGWNGTYRGNLVPSSDYWYKMEMAEGQTFTGSFSLIRR